MKKKSLLRFANSGCSKNQQTNRSHLQTFDIFQRNQRCSMSRGLALSRKCARMMTRRMSVLVKCACLKRLNTWRWLFMAIFMSVAVLYAIAIKRIIHFKDLPNDHLPSTWKQQHSFLENLSVPDGALATGDFSQTPWDWEEPEEMVKESTSFLVDSAGCQIPALDPWNPQLRQFIFDPPPIDCMENRGPPLVASNLTSLFIVKEAVPFYAENSSQIECCYQPLQRRQGSDDLGIMQAECKIFERDTHVQDEFVQVWCSKDNKWLYQDYHAFVPRRPDVEKRCRNAFIRSASLEGSAHSVLVLGIDSVSRLNLHRQMPLTVDLLKQMGAVEMLGLHKVGDNTFPNLVALLTGLHVEELKNNCWPTQISYFDKCPFVWKDYRDAGFRTAYGEDATETGTFSHCKRGFIDEPTDYYLRPFLKMIEELIGHYRPGIAKLCVGSRMTIQVLLQYVLHFAQTFKKDPYFGLFWAGGLSHDDLNFVSLTDDMYVKLLLELRDSGALGRTVLLLTSDHGFRLDSFRETYQGAMEDRLPVLFLLFPDWFRERFPMAVANVERNARRLTSHFDTFETLQDLIRPAERLSQEAVRGRSWALAKATASPEGPPRGVSLFLPVPPDRTCDQAGIEPHWCTCLKKVSVDKGNEIVNRCAILVVNHINQMIHFYRKCAHLSLAEVKDVHLQLPQEKFQEDTEDRWIHYYGLVVRTEPGGAIFEATVRHKVKTNELTMAGFVSRLNEYGSQSACINDYLLKLYCYCQF